MDYSQRAPEATRDAHDVFLPDCYMAMRNRKKIEAAAKAVGLSLRILNNNEHWEFRREGALFEWWPSTGRYLIDKRGSRRNRIEWLSQVKAILVTMIKGV